MPFYSESYKVLSACCAFIMAVNLGGGGKKGRGISRAKSLGELHHPPSSSFFTVGVVPNLLSWELSCNIHHPIQAPSNIVTHAAENINIWRLNHTGFTLTLFTHDSTNRADTEYQDLIFPCPCGFLFLNIKKLCFLRAHMNCTGWQV